MLVYYVDDNSNQMKEHSIRILNRKSSIWRNRLKNSYCYIYVWIRPCNVCEKMVEYKEQSNICQIYFLRRIRRLMIDDWRLWEWHGKFKDGRNPLQPIQLRSLGIQEKNEPSQNFPVSPILSNISPIFQQTTPGN